MDRQEITMLLNALIERDVLKQSTWAKEVSYAKLDSEKQSKKMAVGGRVDYMSFHPENLKPGYCMTKQDIANGHFVTYEIKSSWLDYRSGCGLNFIGDYNYLVVTLTFYHELSSKSLIPENVGVLVPIRMYKGKQTEQFFNDAINNPEPLTNDLNEWRLYTVKKANRVERKHGTEELLYSMLKSSK